MSAESVQSFFALAMGFAVAGLISTGYQVLTPATDELTYRLTAAGRDLFGAIVTLMRWGDEHLPHPNGPPIVLRHNACGEIADARLTCAHCGGEITAHNVTPEPGSGYT